MEARWLVKVVQVVIAAQGHPAFVTVRIDNEQYYQSITVVTQNPTEFQSALHESQRKLAAAQRSFTALQALGALAPDRAALLWSVLASIAAARAASETLHGALQRSA